MIWHQGEADASLTYASAYEANLTSLISRVRQDVFSGVRLPIIIGSLSSSQDASIATPGSAWYIVRHAQENVAQNGIQVGFVNTDGYPTRPGEAIHFNDVGQIALGQDFAAEILRLEALDPDRDGLLLDEETALGTDPNEADTDHDGQWDGVEVQAGTNPTNSASFFAVTTFGLVGELAHLEWPSKPGNFDQVKRSPNLVDWTVLAANYPAAATGSLTGWIESPAAAGDGVLARYDMQSALNGDFNTTAFDSVDTETSTTATRLVQGGSLTGGGASAFVLANAVFSTSASGSPGLNLAGVTAGSQGAAAAAGDFFSFTHLSGGLPVTYESLAFYADQYGTSGKVDVSYTVNGTEMFILQGFVPAGSNANVELNTIDFEDFTTPQDVTWKFYLYGAAGTTHGTRFDDITLSGVTTSTPTKANLYFYRVRLLSP